MPRQYTKNYPETWTDDEFIRRPIFDKLLWTVLRGQPATLLNNCGVQPLSLRRWCKALCDGDATPSEADVLAALARMEADGLVYTDVDTCEVFDARLMVDDELDKQPTVLLNALRFAALVESPKIAAALLDIFTTAIKPPDITGDKPYSVKLRATMKDAYEDTLTHLRALAARYRPAVTDTPDGGSGGPSSGGSPRPTTGGSNGGSLGGSTRPAETGPTPGGSPGGSWGPPVVVEVEVVKEPLGLITLGGRARDDHEPPGTAPTHPTDAPPPRTCPRHPDGTTDACPPCGNARRRHDDWQRTANEHAAARARAEADARRAAAQAAAQAITDCPLCDTDGYRLPTCNTVCDHTDRTNTTRNGLARARAALKATSTTDTTTEADQ